jgi:hypothetical protein
MSQVRGLSGHRPRAPSPKRKSAALSAPSYPGTGPRCRCGCPYLRGLVLLPLVLTASESRGIGLAGPTVRDLPVESVTCKACGRYTVTRDLPPIGIDVAAVLEQLAAAGQTARPSLDARATSPVCTCGSHTLTWSTVVALTVHTAGTRMLGEVSPRSPAGTPRGTLRCGAGPGGKHRLHRGSDSWRRPVRPLSRRGLSDRTRR